MKPVCGIIVSSILPNELFRLKGTGFLRVGRGPLMVELVRGADGRPCLRDTGDGSIHAVGDLPPFSRLHVTELPGDQEGRQLLEAIVGEGLKLADGDLPG